jgi:hypothetical protein
MTDGPSRARSRGRRRREREAHLDELLADESVWAEPSGDLEDRVVRAVLEAEPFTGTPLALIAPSVTPPEHRVTPRGRRQRRRHPRAYLSAAAAVAAIAIATGVVIERRADAPDFRTELSATALAPDARGTAAMYKTDAGFRIELDAHGLPALPAGRYYEVWLKQPEGAAVPIGTFSKSSAHGGAITLWSGVSPDQYPMFSVSIERADNDQVPSGQRVLVGRTNAA